MFFQERKKLNVLHYLQHLKYALEKRDHFLEFFTFNCLYFCSFDVAQLRAGISLFSSNKDSTCLYSYKWAEKKVRGHQTLENYGGIQIQSSRAVYVMGSSAVQTPPPPTFLVFKILDLIIIQERDMGIYGCNMHKHERPWWLSGLRWHAISQLIVAIKGPGFESPLGIMLLITQSY